MLRYKRPSEPPQFATAVAPLKESVAKQISVLMQKSKKKGAKKKRGVNQKKGGQKDSQSKLFKPAWKNYKDIFSYTQFEKCGFCESDVTKSGHGDVEHYYPKSEVWELSDQNGRTVLSEFGYWWMAYEWKNYLFACAKCNQTFKGSYFPVKQKQRCLPPSQRPAKKFPRETPLLLNPYGTLDPRRHLQFDSMGLADQGKSTAFGRETIRTCGLNRQQLVKARYAKVLRAVELIEELAVGNNVRDLSVLRRVYLFGRDSEEHVGMVRAVFEDLGVHWQVCVTRFAEEICRQLKTAAPDATAALELYLEPMGRERYEHWKLVREIFEKSSGSAWSSLVRRRAEQLARELLDAQRRPQNAYANLLEERFYEMGRESPSSLMTVVNVFESRTGQSWNDLERNVRNRKSL